MPTPHAPVVLLRETVAQRASFAARHLAAAIMVVAQLDDYDVALELAPQSIQDIRWSHDPPQLAAVLCVVARGLVDRDPDAAAVVQGAARMLGPTITTGSGSTATNEAERSHTSGLIVEVLRETSRRLLDTLGEELLRELRERGRRMDIDEAVAYTLTHLVTYLRRPQHAR